MNTASLMKNIQSEKQFLYHGVPNQSFHRPGGQRCRIRA
jgi:hypothetical protein